MTNHLRSLSMVMAIASAGGALARVAACDPAQALAGPTTAQASAGKVSREARATAPFHKIRLRGAIELTFRIGPQLAVEVIAEARVLPLVSTEVTDDTLQLGLRAPGGRDASLSSPIRAIVTAPSLHALDVGGACSATVAGLRADSFALAVGGAASAQLSGAVAHATVAAAGVGRVRGEQLRTERATVAAKGGAAVELTVARQLTVAVSGISAVTVYGKPEHVVKAISGAATVTVR
jgi:Putative auto-transporter adhesin, head GIN domain